MAVENWTPTFSRVCPMCGKTFLPAWQHAYKDKTDSNGSRLVCTYHCMRESERRAEEAREKVKRGMCRVDPQNMTDKQRAKWLCRNSVKCPDCRYSREIVGETTAAVYCTHPDREYIARYWRVHHKSNGIGYLGVLKKNGEYHFTRTPKWCPIRKEVLET